MENWGLVTYRETALLYSDASNSLLNKQSVASIIAHELAHFVSSLLLFLCFHSLEKPTYFVGLTKLYESVSFYNILNSGLENLSHAVGGKL